MLCILIKLIKCFKFILNTFINLFTKNTENSIFSVWIRILDVKNLNSFEQNPNRSKTSEVDSSLTYVKKGFKSQFLKVKFEEVYSNLYG